LCCTLVVAQVRAQHRPARGAAVWCAVAGQGFNTREPARDGQILYRNRHKARAQIRAGRLQQCVLHRLTKSPADGCTPISQAGFDRARCAGDCSE